MTIACGCGAHVKTPERRRRAADTGPVAPQATAGALRKSIRCAGGPQGTEREGRSLAQAGSKAPNLRGERVGHDDAACARSAQEAFVPTSVTTRWPCRWLRARDRYRNGRDGGSSPAARSRGVMDTWRKFGVTSPRDRARSTTILLRGRGAQVFLFAAGLESSFESTVYLARP